MSILILCLILITVLLTVHGYKISRLRKDFKLLDTYMEMESKAIDELYNEVFCGCEPEKEENKPLTKKKK